MQVRCVAMIVSSCSGSHHARAHNRELGALLQAVPAVELEPRCLNLGAAHPTPAGSPRVTPVPTASQRGQRHSSGSVTSGCIDVDVGRRVGVER